MLSQSGITPVRNEPHPSASTAAAETFAAGAKRRSVGRKLAVALIALASIAMLAIWWVPIQLRQASGEFLASEYGWVRSRFALAAPQLPTAIPANAKGVAIFSPALVWNLMPPPDQYLELRMILPQADARQFAATARLRDETIRPQVTMSWNVPRLRTFSGDINASSVQNYLLDSSPPPGKASITGVTIDVETGEAVYWFCTW